MMKMMLLEIINPGYVKTTGIVRETKNYLQMIQMMLKMLSLW
jgi:hypothetical protein